MGGEDGCGGGLGILFCVPDTDDIKQKKKNHERILSRFSLSKKQRSLLFYVICVQYTTQFDSVIWNPLISGQIVDSFGQGKCTSFSLGI